MESYFKLKPWNLILYSIAWCKWRVLCLPIDSKTISKFHLINYAGRLWEGLVRILADYVLLEGCWKFAGQFIYTLFCVCAGMVCYCVGLMLMPWVGVSPLASSWVGNPFFRRRNYIWCYILVKGAKGFFVIECMETFVFWFILHLNLFPGTNNQAFVATHDVLVYRRAHTALASETFVVIVDICETTYVNQSTPTGPWLPAKWNNICAGRSSTATISSNFQ